MSDSKVAVRNSDAGNVYAPKPPGAKVMEYDKETATPTPTSVDAVPPTVGILGSIDPTAVNVLSLIQGAKFRRPFTVTLMRRSGLSVFKTDAGQKTETAFEIHQETISEPADLLRINAAIASGVFKTLNNNTLEFQLMLFLAAETGILGSI